MISISSSIAEISPSELFTDGFELQNQTVIPMESFSGSFTQDLNNIEFYVYDANKNIQYSDYDFSNYSIISNNTPGASPAGQSFVPRTTNTNLYERNNNYTSERNSTTKFQSTTDIVAISPEEDVYNAGYTTGKLYGVYNFVNLELSSSIDNPFYLAEISSDRTEIRLKTNYQNNNQIQSGYLSLSRKLEQAQFFDEFYISFGQNEYHIGVNTQLSVPTPGTEDQQYSILIKLYDPLPIKYQLLDELYVVTKTAETKAFQVEYIEDLGNLDDLIQLKGPNTNLKIKDFINNSTTYKNKNELLGTESSGSKDQLLNRLKQDGIVLTPNYSTASFNEFVNFSSAKSRVNNFYEKVGNIQAYEADITSLSNTTSSNSGVTQISSSIASLYTKIEDEISNFDGFEYYQYYNTGSDAYPKTGSSFPLELLSTSSAEVLRWLGSDVENNQYYGGAILSASLYDYDNQNWLWFTIPEFIKEQSNNDNYIDFVNMTGQSFDELWMYTKAITEKLNTTNELDKGVPLSLADDVITSLGYAGYGNNYNNQDNFIGLTGEDNGVYVPSTGSELITQYIAINNGQIANYWQYDYSVQDYVQQLLTAGFPYPIDKVSNEIYKRLYHNMAYLVKKKGTVAGLRQLINIWGVPSTILRINEFGGKNKDQTDDYDLWYNRYSYAYKPVADSYNASSSIVVPWLPLNRNYIAESSSFIVPDGVGFRFKTTGHPSSSFDGNYYSQSLIAKKSDGTADDNFDWTVNLFWTGSQSGSYSGSGNSDYYEYGVMNLIMSGSADDGGTAISEDIYLPFFDGGWWSVLVQRDQHPNAVGLSSGFNSLLATLNSGVGANANPTDCTAGTYTNVALTGGDGTGAVADIVCAQSGSGTPDPVAITEITLTKTGTGYAVGNQLNIAAGALGSQTLAGTIAVGSITSPSGTYTTAGFPGPNGGGNYPSVALTTVTGTGAGGDVNVVTNDQGGITSITVDTIGSGYATGNQVSIAAGDLGGGTVIGPLETPLSYAGAGTLFPVGTYTYEDTSGGTLTQTAGTDGDNLSIRFTVDVVNTLPASVEVLMPGFGYAGNCVFQIPNNAVVGNSAVNVSVPSAAISANSEAITITLQASDINATSDAAAIVLTAADLANGDNGRATNYTLFAKNKIYDGNDGNSIGFEGSASISTGGGAGSGALYGSGLYGSGVYGTYISSSVNKAWNMFGTVAVPDGVHIGGALTGVEIAGIGTNNFLAQEPGKIFSGSFQEFRYYSHDISESVFNDFVMNPESIEGNFITGSESSFDIVNFRAPLGNELTNFFTASQGVTSSNVTTFLTSSHPAVTASAPEYITASFIDTATDTYDRYSWIQYQNTAVRTFSEPNTETYFLDQPAVGIRNRISNKIQATSNLNFGNVLSNQVSIQKDPFISQSYTENINTLEVAFSPTSEIDDDIIQSLGYGAIQEVIADPRFRSSSDDIYPGLRKIADDYFRKYIGSDPYDYIRLIKYFDDSLFKAIKNYVPARTSVSTGIVIKQNLLERNRYREPQMDIVTTQSYATTNVPLTYKNLMLSGSIYSQSAIVDIEGGAGGPYNQYNTLETGSIIAQIDGPNTNITVTGGGDYMNFLYRLDAFFLNDAANTGIFPQDTSDTTTQATVSTGPFFTVEESLRTPIYWNPKWNSTPGDNNLNIIVSSDKRGEIFNSQYNTDGESSNPAGRLLTSGYDIGTGAIGDIMYVDMHPGERLRLLFKSSDDDVIFVNDSSQAVISFGNSKDIFNLLDGTPLLNSASINLPMSQQGYFANEVTTLGTITSSFIDNEEQFYNGELSGSEFNTFTYSSSYVSPYNPYARVSKNSTGSAAFQSLLPVVDLSAAYISASEGVGGGSSGVTTLSSQTATGFTSTAGSGDSSTVSFLVSRSLIPGQEYLMTYDLNVTAKTSPGNVGISTFNESPTGGYFSENGIGFGNVKGQVDSFSGQGGGLGYTTGVKDTIPATFISASVGQEIQPFTGTVAEGSGLRVNIGSVDGSGAPSSITIVDGGSGYSKEDPGSVNIIDDGVNKGCALTIGAAGAVVAASTGNKAYSQSFRAYQFDDDIRAYMSVNFITPENTTATLSNFKVEGQGEFFDGQVAPIYLNPLQQDQWQVLNTQSILFDNSDYNPLNNFIMPQRSSSFRYALTYDQSQTQPTEFNNLVTWSYENQSVSASAPNPATLEDSNYTQQSYTLPRYRGSKLKSLDYNFFTPSGTVGPIQAQPTAPYNIGYGYSSSVAIEFLDGATGSYTGDLSYGQTSCINKNPQYIAHFQSSFSPTSYYQAMQFNIDSLIQIPMDSISGSEITPNSIDINGDNENKKSVSSVFEPSRLMQFTFDDLTFNNIQYGTIGAGPYKILNSATVFKTINSNARNFAAESQTYQYQQAGVPLSQSVVPLDDVGTIQMVTASNITVTATVPTQSNGFLLSGSNYYVANISESFLPFATSASTNEPTIPPPYRLELSGPQLALFHTYNKLVESGSTRQDPTCLTPESSSTIWVKDGLDPTDKDNYYSWYPTGSNCGNYADYQEPFLINRGDVIRAEGLREIFVENNKPSQSLSFNQEFTVLEVQNYRYSGSQGTLVNGAFIDNSSPIIDTAVTTTNAGTFTIAYQAGASSTTGFITDGSGTDGTISLTATTISKFNRQITSAFLVVGSSAGYVAGDTLTISSAVLNSAGFGISVGNLILTLQGANVQTGTSGPNSGFRFKVDKQCWNGGTERYNEQPEGVIEFVAPTFLKVTPDPLVALNGLDSGAITKFTVRREVEQDNRVIARGVQPPSGSKGTRTQSGGGYLIPNDLTLQQKENALNIINQLRAKNAFPGNDNTSS